jgi:hypothetical protein
VPFGAPFLVAMRFGERARRSESKRSEDERAPMARGQSHICVFTMMRQSPTKKGPLRGIFFVQVSATQIMR